jgi:ribosomal protein S18 acetylase RimI-like enzyme
MPDTVRVLRTYDDLHAAAGGDPFVRHEVGPSFRGPGFSVTGAVAFVRQNAVGRRSMACLGSPRAIDRLLAGVRDTAQLAALAVTSVSVPADAEPVLHQHFQVGEGGDWEWMWTTAAPPATPGESVLVDLGADDLPQVQRLLEVGNPTTHARPGEHGDERWVGVRHDGQLVGCAVMERNGAGRPHLAGITVHPSRRGLGLGLAMTAHLTRRAVDADGVCTLGMYASNDVARRLYHGLGYVTAHAWCTRQVACP